MFSAVETGLIFSQASPIAKRDGIDFTLAEMYDAVSHAAACHEANIVIPPSSFHRARRALGIRHDNRGFYSKGDAAILLGWFASQGSFKTYQAYLEECGRQIHRRYTQ